MNTYKNLSGYLSVIIICLFGCVFHGQNDIYAQSDSTFAEHWKYIGIAVQEPGYTIWGTSPIVDNNGKVHLFTARWPKQYGVDPGWRTHSEIAHYVGDNPEGPFKFSDVALQGTGENTWDKYAPHNPTIHQVGDLYVLLYIANNDDNHRPHPSNECIGMAVSKSLYGPWKKVNGDGRILRPPLDTAYWNFDSRKGVGYVVNPALLPYKGGFLLYFKTGAKSGVSTMGLAVSERLTGPYQQLPFPVTKNNKIIEDGYAFIYNGEICLLSTDNSGIIEKGGGVLWKSKNGVSFDHNEQGFKLISEYVDPKNIKDPKWYYGQRDEMKFERPQILMIDGKPGYLYVASGCNIYGGDATVSYVLKFVR